MSYGLVEIGGKKYTERTQEFPEEVTVTVNNQVLTNQRIVLPGVANFLLKALERETVVAGASAARRFKFRLGNTDGGLWYMAGGSGGSTDRVLDTLTFGNAQFPKVLIPALFYSASASILFEIEDVSANVPYTIYFNFVGAYLIPLEDQNG